MLTRINRAVAALLLPTAWRGEKSRHRPSSGSFFRRLKAFGLIGLSLLIAGCNPAQYNRTVRYGIGTDLYSPTMARDTQYLEAYLGYLCVQAGFGGYDANGRAACPTDREMNNTEGWTLLVATGWNDIDARCDGYLAWLDAQRRKRAFVSTEVGHIRTFASGLFAAIDPGNLTVNLVGVALGLAHGTYDAYTSQILLDFEGSTVETIVISRRLAFRTELGRTKIKVKPDAVRILRDYLRICTPYAIRMSVNTYSRASATGDTPIQMNEAQRLHESLLSSVITDAGAPMRPAPRAPIVVVPPGDTDLAQRVGDYEQRLLPTDISTFQRVVCLPQNGRFTIATRKAILEFLIRNQAKDNNFPKEISPNDGITMREMDENPPACPG